MTTETTEQMTTAVLENAKATQDAMTVKRVFGEAYEVDGKTIIPLARVGGGGGGGGGDGEEEAGPGAEEKSGSGFGSGFGLTVRPVGVYVVDGDGVEWKPAVDVSRLAKGGQVLAGIITICVTLVLLQRGRT